MNPRQERNVPVKNSFSSTKCICIRAEAACELMENSSSLAKAAGAMTKEAQMVEAFFSCQWHGVFWGGRGVVHWYQGWLKRKKQTWGSLASPRLTAEGLMRKGLRSVDFGRAAVIPAPSVKGESWCRHSLSHKSLDLVQESEGKVRKFPNLNGCAKL